MCSECSAVRLTGFIKGWMITDIVFESLRLLMVPVLLVNVMCGGCGDYPVLGCLELALGVMIPLLGFPASIGILCRQKWAVTFGYAVCAVTLISCLDSLFSGLFIVAGLNGEYSTIYQTAFYFGMVGTTTVRVVFLVFYFIAVKRTAVLFRG